MSYLEDVEHFVEEHVVLLVDLPLPDPVRLRVLVVQVLESGRRLVVHRRLDRQESAHEVALLLLLPTSREIDLRAARALT